MEGKGKIAFVLSSSDAFYFDGITQYLVEEGWDIEMIIHSPNISPFPKGMEVYDVVMVYGMGVRNWFVDALVELNKPTVYLSTVGGPDLELEKLVVIGGFFSLEQLQKAVKRVLA